MSKKKVLISAVIIIVIACTGLIYFNTIQKQRPQGVPLATVQNSYASQTSSIIMLPQDNKNLPKLIFFYVNPTPQHPAG